MEVCSDENPVAVVYQERSKEKSGAHTNTGRRDEVWVIGEEEVDVDCGDVIATIEGFERRGDGGIGEPVTGGAGNDRRASLGLWEGGLAGGRVRLAEVTGPVDSALRFFERCLPAFEMPPGGARVATKRSTGGTSMTTRTDPVWAWVGVDVAGNSDKKSEIMEFLSRTRNPSCPKKRAREERRMGLSLERARGSNGEHSTWLVVTRHPRHVKATVRGHAFVLN